LGSDLGSGSGSGPGLGSGSGSGSLVYADIPGSDDNCITEAEFDAAFGSGPIPNGEEACEGHDFSQEECENVGCCHWNSGDGRCWSDVGQDACVGSQDAPAYAAVANMDGDPACMTEEDFNAFMQASGSGSGDGSSGVWEGSGSGDGSSASCAQGALPLLIEGQTVCVPFAMFPSPATKHCTLPKTWQELITTHSQDEFEAHYITGGLGRLMLPNELETWLCTLKASDINASDSSYEGSAAPCPLPTDGDAMCFTYHEAAHVFVPWGLKSTLGVF